MENQDLDLIGQTAGNMPYKIGIVDEKGNLKNQFVAKASTNRIDIPQSSLGTGGGGIPYNVNLFSGSAVGNILLSRVTPNYDNVQDGLLLTLGSQTLEAPSKYSLADKMRIDLLPTGLTGIKIPKEKLVANSSFDISDQVSQYIGKTVQGQYIRQNLWTNFPSNFSFSVVSFSGTAIRILPNTTLSMNLAVSVKQGSDDVYSYAFPIPVIRVNTYKNYIN